MLADDAVPAPEEEPELFAVGAESDEGLALSEEAVFSAPLAEPEAADFALLLPA